MNVIVIGCGRAGSRLAGALEEEGHKVVVVDSDSESFMRLSPLFKGVRVQGDALDSEVLIKAGIQQADAIACVTNSDSLTAIVAIAARDRFKVPKQVVRIFDPVEAEGYRRLGIPMIAPSELGATLIKDMICHPTLYQRLAVGNGEVRIIEIAVPPGMVGRSSESVNVPGEILVISIIREGKAAIAHAGMILQKGDTLSLACLSTAISRVEELQV